MTSGETCATLRRAAIVLSWALVAAGCQTSYVERLARLDAEADCIMPEPARDLLVGVAISGGGSRAALFGAAGLESLARVRAGPQGRSLLEQVTHISSVSGGSLAAVYYALQKPPREVSVLTPQGDLTAEYRRFFGNFKNAMSEDYEAPTFWRQITRLRLLNPTKAATSVSEVLDDRIGHGATLSTLMLRESSGDSPRIIINTTLYNNGRRFVITTMPRADFRYDLIHELERTLDARGRAAGRLTESLPSLVRAQEVLLPLTFEDINARRCDVPLSKAIAASASFPMYVGPVTAQVDGEAIYWHAGDGGLFDNQGTESLVQLFMRKLQQGQARRALIIALDSSFPFWVTNERLDLTDQGFRIFDDDVSRIPGIMEQRANAYQAMVWHILQSEGIVLPDADTIKVIVLRHTDAAWDEDLGDLPAICRDDDAPPDSAGAIVQRLARILTRFHLRSECERALLSAAAAKAVTQQQGRIVEFLDASHPR